MNKQKQEILEYVKINAVIENMKHEETGEEKIDITLWYPCHGREIFFFETYPIPSAPISSDPDQEPLKTWFAKIVKEIKETLKNKPEGHKWEIKKVIYKVCPEMICGNNPCSCEEVSNE